MTSTAPKDTKQTNIQLQQTPVGHSRHGFDLSAIAQSTGILAKDCWQRRLYY